MRPKFSCIIGMAFAIRLIASPLPGSLVPNPPFAPASLASPMCNAAACDVLEGRLVNLPYIAFAGDAVLLDPSGAVSDVVRFFNNVLDTGGGTGFSTQILMYSKIDTGVDLSVGPDLGLPNPSTYSVNAVRLLEAPDGSPTVYNGNGTLYSFYSDTPEPSTIFYMAAGLLALATRARFSWKTAFNSRARAGARAALP